MLRTALSASLVALAVLAPVASAAPEPKAGPVKEPKAPVLDDKTAKYCAEIAAVKPDKKGVITLTKEQLAVQPLCPAEEPKDCPDAGKQKKLDDTVKEYAQTGSSSHRNEWPEWLKQSYRAECSLGGPDTAEAPQPDKPFDPRVTGSSKLQP